ncbi:MAG: hypothetical protein IJ220_02105 [Clostridia bacterium]|nr:hypothetical protein [Clostridia bacterium]
MSKNKKISMSKERNIYRTKGKGIVEDATEYGEFISSFDVWLTPEEQKRNAERLEHLGD